MSAPLLSSFSAIVIAAILGQNATSALAKPRVQELTCPTTLPGDAMRPGRVPHGWKANTENNCRGPSSAEEQYALHERLIPLSRPVHAWAWVVRTRHRVHSTISAAVISSWQYERFQPSWKQAVFVKAADALDLLRMFVDWMVELIKERGLGR